MDLTILTKYKDLHMSNWEKIFVSNFYKGKPMPNKTTEKKRVDLIREDIIRELETLYSYGDGKHDDYFSIESNCDAVKREYKNNIMALRGRGENIDSLETQGKEEQLRFIADEHSRQHRQQYKYIVEILKNELYDPAFKYLILNEALTKIYKKEPDKNGKMQTINKPRDITKSTEEFLTLNRTIMNHIYETVENNKDGEVLKNSKGKTLSFADLYFEALDDYTNTVSKKNTISLEGVETYGKGSWIKFEGKTSNPDKYIENATELAALVQRTPWCTKTLAFQQLNEGDFFVFVDNEHKPHVAVKMLGDEIDEVRGIKGGDAQELEENYRDVTISFLEKNKDIKNGLEWLEKEEWNQRLVNYGKKLEAKEFTTEDVEKLIRDLFFREDYKNHAGQTNTNLARLRSKLYMGRKQFAEHFKCKEEEIYCGDVGFYVNSKGEEFLLGDDAYFYDNTSKQLKIILGNADFSCMFSGKDITIYGDASFSGLNDLPIIQNIYGRNAIKFNNCYITSLENLKEFNGRINVLYSTIANLEHPCLTHVNLQHSTIESFGNTRSLEALNVDYSNVKDFGDLSGVENLMIKGNSPITNLGNIKTVDSLYIEGVNLIKSLNINEVNLLDISGENLITSLGPLKKANRIILYSPSIRNLGDLTSVYELQLCDGHIKDMGNVKNVEILDLSQTDGIIDLSNVEYLGEVKFPPDKKKDSPEDIIHGSTTIKVEGNPQQMEAVKARIKRHREIKAENEREQKDAEMSWGNFNEDLINPAQIGKITLTEQNNTKVKQIIAKWISACMEKLKKLKEKIGR